LLAAGGALAACGGADAVGPNGNAPDALLGTYEVATVNDHGLPVAIFADTAYSYERMSGRIILTPDGKYSSTMTSRQTVAGVVDIFVDSTGGTWTLSGTQVHFTDGADGATDQAEWSSGKLTFSEAEGTATNTYVYLRKP
jgi:hypothetical protein